MSLKELLQSAPTKSKNQPAQVDTAKVSALLADNKARAENILLAIKLSLPAAVDTISTRSEIGR